METTVYHSNNKEEICIFHKSMDLLISSVPNTINKNCRCVNWSQLYDYEDVICSHESDIDLLEIINQKLNRISVDKSYPP